MKGRQYGTDRLDLGWAGSGIESWRGSHETSLVRCEIYALWYISYFNAT